jgi:hypothetical protein
MLRRVALTVALLVLVRPAGAQSSNQITQPSPPAYVAVVDGVAFIERDSRVETSPLNMPLVSGDRLRTTEGRMEIRFADGSALDLDARTIVDLQSDTLLRLMDGRIRVTVRSAAPDTWRIDSPAGSARLAESGEYRLALVAGPRQEEGDVQLELAVFRGSGEIFTDHGKTTVNAGERAYASADLLPSEPYPFNSAASDDFDRWPASPAPLSAEPSSEYLPSDLQSYSSTLDAYGDWLYLPAYGHVWCPRVTVDWRPYAYGRWMTYPRYGLTWIGSEPFAWPTHHYGSWGMVGGRWFWMPSPTWAPAHVTWSSAGDSVGWAPVGPGNRAVDSPATRTVMARSDFDRHTIVPEARPIDRTPMNPINRTRVRPIDQTHGVPGAAAVPRTVAPSSAPQPMLAPARTSPAPNPVPRSHVRPAPAAAPASVPLAWRTQPSPAAQPRPGQPSAPTPPSAAVPRPPAPPQAAAPQPAAHPPAQQPPRGPQPAAQQPSAQQPAAQQPAAQQPAHAVSRGRGGV